MRRLYKVLIIILIVIVLIGVSGAYFINKVNQSLTELQNTSICGISPWLYDDGIYEGTYKVFPIEVIVNVHIVDHEITKIDLVKHVNGQGSDAEVIIDDIINSQSIDVDFISGATYSSYVILLAVVDAIPSNVCLE